MAPFLFQDIFSEQNDILAVPTIIICNFNSKTLTTLHFSHLLFQLTDAFTENIFWFVF